MVMTSTFVAMSNTPTSSERPQTAFTACCYHFTYYAVVGDIVLGWIQGCSWNAFNLKTLKSL